MSEDIEPQPKDIMGRTWQKAFYIQTKAFLEKNSEHIKEIARLKADVERLEKEKQLPFAYGGTQLLVDLNKLLTAHRHYCDVNAIDYRQMEQDALNSAKEGKLNR
jgi:hypothetical protein